MSLEFVPLAILRIVNVTIPHYHFALKTTLLVGYTSTYFAYTYVDRDDVELFFLLFFVDVVGERQERRRRERICECSLLENCKYYATCLFFRQSSQVLIVQNK